MLDFSRVLTVLLARLDDEADPVRRAAAAPTMSLGKERHRLNLMYFLTLS